MLSALVVVVLVAACGRDQPASPAQAATSTRPAVDPDLVTLRPIVSELHGPCGAPTGEAELVLPDPDDATSCLALGPAGLDASGVATASLRAIGATEVEVVLDLTAAGGRDFNRLVAAHKEKRLALVAYGRILYTRRVFEPLSPSLGVPGLRAKEATAMVRAFGGDTTPPTTSPDQPGMDRAVTVCQSYGKRTRQVATGVLGPTTAGKVTSTARQLLGHVVPPWDSLSADHFVASCAYEAPSSGEPSTTVCPNGEAFDLAEPKQMLVDEEGRATADPFADEASRHLPPCS